MECGLRFDAACELPGLAFERCPKKCTRTVGHPGRCWCDFHAKWPNQVWQSEEEALWKGTSFKDVLALLELKGLEQHATTIFQLGINTPKQLADIGLEQLWAAGWSQESTDSLRNAKVPERIRR